MTRGSDGDAGMADALELAAGQARVRLSPELGGRVTALRLVPPGATEARDVLLPFPEDTRPGELLRWPKGGIYPLIPYGNRIRDARLRLPWAAVEVLPPHPDAAPHTLHGHAHRVPWAVADRSDDRAELVLRHPGGGEWPWRFVATQLFQLQPDALRIRLAIRNEDARPMPAGLGLHPYFLHRPADRLGFRAATDWPLTPDLLGDPPVPAPADYEQPCALPDGTVTLYRGEWDGCCTLDALAGRVAITASAAFGHLVVHRPDGAPYACVEPSSHAPDGFNLAEAGIAGTGRVVLRQGETLEGEVTIALSSSPGAP